METNGCHHELGVSSVAEDGDNQDYENGRAGKNGRHRPRKRKLYSDICKQMEFYFSDANITKNRMMREIVEEANKNSEGFVDLTIFLDFTKIQQLTTTVKNIRKALVTSDKLELSGDGGKARRKTQFDPSKLKSEADVEESTIYVENVPRDSDHDWLEKIFQAFGPVAYISMPKFKSGQHKGFAFVEFDDRDAARSCLEAYGEEGACLPSDIDPAQLRSIQSFGEENQNGEGQTQGSSEKSSGGKQNGKKRKCEISPQEDDAPVAKKGKKEQDDDHGASSSSSDSDKEGVIVMEESKSRKKKRKKNTPKKSVEAKLESESIMLKVLPKKSWRQLRNRYLNLQRSNMSKLKKELQQPFEKKGNKSNSKFEPVVEQNNVNNDHEFEEQKVYDLIMQIYMNKPAESSEELRRKISVELAEQDEDEAMVSGFVKFIDYKDNELQVFVRVNGDISFSNRAENLLKRSQEAFSSARYLSASEVDVYRKQVQAALKDKQKQKPRKNVRGKDRLMKAAINSSHIRFESSDDEADVTQETNDDVKVKGGTKE